MKIFELRGYLRERGIRGYSMLKKGELEAKVREIKEKEEVAMYERELRDTVRCAACLDEQRKQRKIDEKTFNQRLFGNVVRTLVCEHCKHTNLARDGGDVLCVICGSLQGPEAVAAVRYRN